MGLNFIRQGFYSGREEGWTQGFPPEDVHRMLGRKTESENLGRREARKAEVVRDQGPAPANPRVGEGLPPPFPAPSQKAREAAKKGDRKRRRDAERVPGKRRGKGGDGGGRGTDSLHWLGETNCKQKFDNWLLTSMQHNVNKLLWVRIWIKQSVDNFQPWKFTYTSLCPPLLPPVLTINI